MTARDAVVVEGTNSWLTDYGQLRRNTDRQTRHRHAQLCLVVVLPITAKLIDWRESLEPGFTSYPLFAEGDISVNGARPNRARCIGGNPRVLHLEPN
jgi:hypothetical protein